MSRCLFEYLQGRTLHHLPGQPVPLLSHAHSKNISPYVQTEPPVFQFVLIVSCLITGHY